MCRSTARIFHMFLRHIEQGLRTRERNISETGVFKALVSWSIDFGRNDPGPKRFTSKMGQNNPPTKAETTQAETLQIP